MAVGAACAVAGESESGEKEKSGISAEGGRMWESQTLGEGGNQHEGERERERERSAC